MNGTIVTFDDQAQEGTVMSESGQRYSFSLVQWRGRGLPGPQIDVTFEVRDGCAVQVFNLPERQRRAKYKRMVDVTDMTPNTVTKRHAGWAIVAIITAMLGLFSDTLAPFVGALATLSALLGLYQIHKSPERYKGKGFCWAAILLALSVATLSLWVEPASAAPL